MSTPSFRAVIFWGEKELRIFASAKSGWSELALLTPDEKISSKLHAELDGANILVVPTDLYAGHVQIALPNKKDQLSDEHLAKVLQDEYQIDLSSYEFASQRFAVGRQFVQVSVSVIEHDAFGRARAWAAQFSPKKLWVMPFGWFVSVLKSVEPALIAVVEDKDHVYVSHHYLGVDDARQVTIAQLGAYTQSRKDERKETHLLYVQATPKLFRAIEKEVADSVAVHPLLGEDFTVTDSMAEVVNAVMEKGSETLHELLHFDVDLTEAPVASSPQEQAEQLEEGLQKQAAVVPADELPRPRLPDSLAAASVLPAPMAPSLEQTVEENEMEEAAAAHVEELQKPEEVIASTPAAPLETEAVDEFDDDAVASPVSAFEEEEPGFLSQLQMNKVAVGNADRYQEVKPKSQWKLAFVVFLVVFIITALIGGGVFWSQQAKPMPQALLPEVTPSPSPSPEPSPTPTPAPTNVLTAAEKSKLTITILNATGTTGLAGKVKTKLEAAGWKNVKTGNAAGTSYDGAVFVSSTNEQVEATLNADLATTVKMTSSLKEPGTEKFDVVIVLGVNPLQ